MEIHLNKNILHFFVTKTQKVANFKLSNKLRVIFLSHKHPNFWTKNWQKQNTVDSGSYFIEKWIISSHMHWSQVLQKTVRKMAYTYTSWNTTLYNSCDARRHKQIVTDVESLKPLL